MDGKIVLTKAYVLAIDGVKVTFAEGKVVHGIQQVGLAGAVIAHKAVDIATKGKVNLLVVLEVAQYKSIQRHSIFFFTSSINQRGVEVAPLMPTLATPSNHSGCTSSGVAMR